MFSGIISNITHVKKSETKDDGILVTFERPSNWDDLQIGESVSTNGICLTVESIGVEEYTCFLMKETLNRTIFGHDIPAKVNVERALRVKERISGHIVQGHIDETGTVVDVSKSEEWVVKIEYSITNSPLVLEKGSITVNGVSLTISNTFDNTFSVSLVPFTLQHTTLGDLKTNDKVNLEFDILGKYINHILGKSKVVK